MTEEVDPQNRMATCVESKMSEEGLTREEAKEVCDRQFAEEIPASAEDVQPEDVYTALDSCMAIRELGGETKEVARRHCLSMFSNDSIKQAFEDEASPEIIGRMLSDWNFAHLPKYKWWRDSKATRERAHEESVKAEMDRLVKERGHLNYPLGDLDRGLRREAEQELAIKRAKIRKSRDHSSRMTVGSTFGKTKEQIIKEDSVSPQTSHTTVGSLYMRKTAAEPEPTPLGKCIAARMQTKGESYETAKLWCERILKEGIE